MVNRYRLKVATTVDPDIAWVINSMSAIDRKGHLLDEIVAEWLVNCPHFQVSDSKIGIVKLHQECLYYLWHDMNDEVVSPKFRTFKEAFTWLRVTYPAYNKHIRI